MKTIETDVVVSRDGKARIELQLSGDVLPGRHRAVVVLDERPTKPASREAGPLDDFPVHNFGPWPDSLSMRREDVYGEDGR